VTVIGSNDISIYPYGDTFFFKKLLYLPEIDLAAHGEDAGSELAQMQILESGRVEVGGDRLAGDFQQEDLGDGDAFVEPGPVVQAINNVLWQFFLAALLQNLQHLLNAFAFLHCARLPAVLRLASFLIQRRLPKIAPFMPFLPQATCGFWLSWTGSSSRPISKGVIHTVPIIGR